MSARLVKLMNIDDCTDKMANRFATLCIRADCILHIKLHHNVNIDIDAAKTIIADIQQLSRNMPMATLVDISEVQFVLREAREYGSKESRNVHRALAILVGSPVSKLFGTLLVNFSRPRTPVKLFNRESDAIEWLQSFTAKTSV